MGCTLSTVASSTYVPPNDRGHRQFRGPLGSQDADAAGTTAAVRIAFSDTALSGPARLRQPFTRTWAPTTPHISFFTHLSACFEPFDVQPAASTDDARKPCGGVTCSYLCNCSFLNEITTPPHMFGPSTATASDPQLPPLLAHTWHAVPGKITMRPAGAASGAFSHDPRFLMITSQSYAPPPKRNRGKVNGSVAPHSTGNSTRL